MANRRFDESLRALSHNDDRLTTEAADAALRTWGDRPASDLIARLEEEQP